MLFWNCYNRQVDEKDKYIRVENRTPDNRVWQQQFVQVRLVRCYVENRTPDNRYAGQHLKNPKTLRTPSNLYELKIIPGSYRARLPKTYNS